MKEYRVYQDGEQWICDVYKGEMIVYTNYGQSPEIALKKTIIYDEITKEEC